MIGNEGFHETITKDPEEPTTRLIYADWLDEHGYLQHAEFQRDYGRSIMFEHRDESGKLTRAGMEAIIKSGGSVMIGSEPVTEVAKLPSAVDLARGNEKAQETLRRQLDDQLQTLLLQRARIDEDVKAAKEKADAEAKEAEKKQKVETKETADAQKQTDRHAPAPHLPLNEDEDDKPERRPVGRPRKDA